LRWSAFPHTGGIIFCFGLHPLDVYCCRSGWWAPASVSRRRNMLLRIHFLLAAVIAMVWAYPDGHMSISFDSLRQLDSVASAPIESLGDATAYVRRAAMLCGIAGNSFVPDDTGSRLATAEWGASKNPNHLVSDDRIAEAFNFVSEEFHVEHPAHLTASDILQYRTVQASLFPHIFSGKNVNGSRPVGAVVILYQLWYSGGVTEGVRTAALLDRAPGTLKVTSGQIVGGSWAGDRNPNVTGREYQLAGRMYFTQRSPMEIQAFLGTLTKIMTIPGGVE
jgi:hypothetical protein